MGYSGNQESRLEQISEGHFWFCGCLDVKYVATINFLESGYETKCMQIKGKIQEGNNIVIQ